MIANPPASIWRFIFALLLPVFLWGCTTSPGPMKVQQAYYLAVPSGKNTNYYRIRVEAKTSLSDAKYGSSWFPADAVDSLYGDAISDTASAEAYKTQTELKEALNSTILSTYQDYLEVASDPKTSDETIQQWMKVQRRVRAMANDEAHLPTGAVEMEYNPTAGMAVRHAGEKQVFVLSANPDDVLKEISAFSSNTETSATILSLADVIQQQAKNEVAELEARDNASKKMDTLIFQQINSLETALQQDLSRDNLAAQVEALRILVESSQ